jgi:serine/threonine-protein kinase RsbW
MMVDKDYQISLDSAPESITEVEAFVEQLREELDIPDELYGNILICLTEAVNNCIIHGNKLDPSKKVTITCTKKDNMLLFIAEDEGNGFDFTALPDPTAPENREKLTGRGVFLMRQLSTQMKYSNGGSTVEMRFPIQLH